MILALTLMFVPLAVILSLTVAHSITFGNGYAMHSQHRARVFYLAESGVNIAYRLFQAENFSADTHEPDGDSRADDDLQLLRDTTDTFHLVRDAEGWFVWRWVPGDPVEESYTESGLEEEFRFQVVRPQPNQFRIVCQARVGRFTESQVLEGDLHPMLNYVVFDNGDLSDFTRSYDDHVTGDIHANGNIYLRPFETAGFPGIFSGNSNPVVNLTVSSLTSAGQIIRHKDAMDNADDGGTVDIGNAVTGKRHLMESVSQGPNFNGPGRAFDSMHPDWSAPLSNPNGALARWDSAVADRSLGAQVKNSALRESLQPGGYYANRASITIDSSTTSAWVEDKVFYNESEARQVSVKELDLQKLAASGQWPANGMIYSEEPVRIVNGHNFVDDLTIVSASTVYIKGDFNKEYPTAGALSSGTPQLKKAAVLTPDRIYRLTSSFQDTPSSDLPTVTEMLLDPSFKATDTPSYPGDEANVLEINGAFIDGTPTTDARAWVEDSGYYVPTNGISLPGLPFFNRTVKQVSEPGDPRLKVAYAQSEALLQNLQNVRLKGKGSIGHLRVAKMAKYDNSDASDTVTPWMVHTFYVPPKQTINGEPGQEFQYDPSLSALGPLDGAPYAPMLGRRVRWARE